MKLNNSLVRTQNNKIGTDKLCCPLPGNDSGGDALKDDQTKVI